MTSGQANDGGFAIAFKVGWRIGPETLVGPGIIPAWVTFLCMKFMPFSDGADQGVPGVNALGINGPIGLRLNGLLTIPYRA